MHAYFPGLPPSARVWLFVADRDLSDAALRAVRDWLPVWTSHGRPVTAQADVLAERVLAVAAVISPEEMNAGVSGCGIDAMTHAVETSFADAGVAQLPALAVAFRGADDTWQALPRPAFRRLVKDGMVSGSTLVLDTTPTDLDTLRQSGVERPAADAWHSRVFGLSAEAGAPPAA